jgi:hypothetical protein
MMSERQAVYRRRSYADTSLNVRGINRKGKRRRFHPDPLEGDGTSRAAFVKWRLRFKAEAALVASLEA